MTSMKKHLVMKAVYFLALGLSLYPGVAKADSDGRAMKGNFQLTSAARWETTVLSPGSYSFVVEHDGAFAIIRVRKDKHVVAAFICQEHSAPSDSSAQDVLTLEHDGAETVIRSMELPDLGVAYSFTFPRPAPAQFGGRTLP